MKIARTAALVGVVVAAGIAAAMTFDPPAALATGSGSAFVPAGLELAPEDATCKGSGFTSSTVRCPVRYAFAPDRALNVWISVRNTGTAELVVDGADEWLRGLPKDLLVQPIAVLDGGSVFDGRGATGAAFSSVTLAPGGERFIGIHMRTTADMKSACQKWLPGTGMGWDEFPVTWHWLAFKRTATIALPRGVQVMAPTPTDCAGR